MSLKQIIEKTQEVFGTPVLRSHLEQGFKKLNIKTGDHLLVHSSLSSIGYIAGGPSAVIESLQKVVTVKGSITMPSHSSTLSDPSYWENPPIPESWWEHYRREASAFNDLTTTTEWMGKIAETFRLCSDVIRSDHPAVSFSSWGAASQDIVSNHSLTFSMGEESPLAKLYNLDAKILLIGVGHSSNTSLHLGEVRSGIISNEVQGAPKLIDGVRQWVEFKDYQYDSDDFIQCGEKFEESKSVTTGSLGLAKCKVMSMREVVDFSAKWFKENRKLESKSNE